MMSNADLSPPFSDFLFPGSGVNSSDSVLKIWLILTFNTYVRSEMNLLNSHKRSETSGAAWGLAFLGDLCVCAV